MEDVGLIEVPEGDWFCNNCTINNHKPTIKSRGKQSKKVIEIVEETQPAKRGKKSMGVVEVPIVVEAEEEVMETRRSVRSKK